MTVLNLQFQWHQHVGAPRSKVSNEIILKSCPGSCAGRHAGSISISERGCVWCFYEILLGHLSNIVEGFQFGPRSEMKPLQVFCTEVV